MTATTLVQRDYSGVDNTIKAAGGSGQPDYTADNGVIGVDFYSTGNKVDFKVNGYKFSWTPQNMKYVDSTGMEDVIYTVQDVAIEVKNNYARFNRPMTDVDDWFIVENNQLKHQILVQGFQRDPVPYLSGEVDFVFGGQVTYDPSLSICAHGLTNITGPFDTDGGIDFRDASGNIVYSLPPIVAYDSGIPNRAQTTGRYNVTQNSAGVLAFDIVIDNAWFADAARIYPIVIDPTVVESSGGYYPPLPNGRGIVKLTNGWILTAFGASSYLYVYVSKDNNASWTQLTRSTSGIVNNNNMAIATNGGTQAVVLCNGSAGTTMQAYQFDATTVAANINYNTVDNTSSGLNGCALAADSTGKYWAVWAQSGSPYPSSSNLKYATSTDGINWSAVTWITTNNATGNNCVSPSLAFLSDNTPVLVYSHQSYVECRIGTTFSTVYTAYGSAGNYPCVAVDNGDVIHVVFQYTTSPQYIGYVKSTNRGQTWSTIVNVSSDLTTVQQYASIGVDMSTGNLHVFWWGIYSSYNTAYNAVLYKKCVGGTWDASSTVIAYTQAGSSGDQAYPTVLWSRFNSNSSDAMRYMWQDNFNGGIKFAQIGLNNPPNAPINLSPTGGTALSTVTPTLSGTFTDPDVGNTMSALQVQVYRSSDNVLMWDSTKTAMTTTTGNQNWSINVPSSANLVYGVQYYWKATTWDNSSAQGAWSGNQTFITEQAPTVTITAPTTAQVLTTSSIVAQLSYSQAANVAEASYQFQLLDTNNNVLQDSGVINSANNQYTFSGLVNNTSYQMAAFATTKNGSRGTATKVSFSTSFTPPNNPTVSATSNSATASNTINWTNPAGTITVAYNRLYKQVAGAWVLTKDNLSGTSYTDYLIGSGVATIYGVSAMGTNGVESAIVSVTQTVTFTGDWLYDSSTGSQFQFLYNRAAYSMETLEERKEYQTFGSKPMIRRGPLNARKGTLDALMVNGNQSPIQQLQALEASMANHPVYYLKTAAGEVLKVDVHTAKRNMPVERLNTQAIGIAVDWTEVA